MCLKGNIRITWHFRGCLLTVDTLLILTLIPMQYSHIGLHSFVYWILNFSQSILIWTVKCLERHPFLEWTMMSYSRHLVAGFNESHSLFCQWVRKQKAIKLINCLVNLIGLFILSAITHKLTNLTQCPTRPWKSQSVPTILIICHSSHHYSM